MIRTIISLLTLLLCQFSFSQGFKVKNFEQNINDGSAFHAPLDTEGYPCGLIKVRTDNPDLRFFGSIVGKVENKTNEYWVYVPRFSKELKVYHPNFLPLVIPFAEYGIEISSKATYVLTLDETKYKKEKAGVTIIVKPEDAELCIDDIVINNTTDNGLYQLYLPKGEHICKFTKVGYRPNVQVIQTGKTLQNISVELENVMAELEIKCKTTSAEIYIDGELIGNGMWNGKILAGKHIIVARQLNYDTITETITLEEKESRLLTIPALKRSMGMIHIETNPTNLPVLIDGEEVGLSPCDVDVISGVHHISCNAYGFVPYRIDVNIEQKQDILINMDYCEGELKKLYQNAYKGEPDAIYCCISTSLSKEDYKQALFWKERHPHKDGVINYKVSDENIDEYWFFQNHIINWILAYCSWGNPEKALELSNDKDYTRGWEPLQWFGALDIIGDAFYKEKKYDKAICCYEKAREYVESPNEMEKIGDCYNAIGETQKAISIYKKCLDSYYYEKRVRQKLIEIENNSHIQNIK